MCVGGGGGGVALLTSLYGVPTQRGVELEEYLERPSSHGQLKQAPGYHEDHQQVSTTVRTLLRQHLYND